MLNLLTWPALLHFPQRMRFAAKSKSQAGSTMTGDFPPSSKVIGVRCLTAAVAITRATLPFPVYMTKGVLSTRINDWKGATHCGPTSV